MSREQLTKGFLWFSVLGWGIGLGAKLFDLIVVATAWGAAPPASLALMPYGPHYPMNPGDFFQPLSALMLVGILGALISGWKTPLEYRIWLWVPAVAFLIIWIFTPTVFWPMIRDLYGIATGKVSATQAEAISLARRWMIWDSARVAVIAVGAIFAIATVLLVFQLGQPRLWMAMSRDGLLPPKGAAGSETRPRFSPTMPKSSFSETRMPRLRSLV